MNETEHKLLIIRREKLTEWVWIKHAGQFIKITGEPYVDHLITVADMVSPVLVLGYEVGLCHDLIEKTNTTAEQFFEALMNFGYEITEIRYILNLTVELTDVFTKALFPDLKSKQRKVLEEKRLVNISPDAQTVKYADLIYNIKWMMRYDLDNARDYLIRKQRLLSFMSAGDQELHYSVSQLIRNSLKAF